MQYTCLGVMRYFLRLAMLDGRHRRSAAATIMQANAQVYILTKVVRMHIFTSLQRGTKNTSLFIVARVTLVNCLRLFMQSNIFLRLNQKRVI